MTVNGTNVTWYDPIYAVGYDYEIVSGPNVGSIIVPPGYGDNKFDLYLWQNGEFVLVQSDLDATVQYWFDEGGISSSPVDNEGVRKFSVRGLELSAKLNPDDTNAFVTGMALSKPQRTGFAGPADDADHRIRRGRRRRCRR